MYYSPFVHPKNIHLDHFSHFPRETINDLSQAIRTLETEEHLILALYYFEDLSFEEIGRVLLISTSEAIQKYIHAMTLVIDHLEKTIYSVNNSLLNQLLL